MSETAKKPDDAEMIVTMTVASLREVIAEEVQKAMGNDDTDGDRLLDAKEAAKLYCVPKSWIAEAARSGELASIKMGHYRRFRREDLQNYIEKHRKEKQA